MRGSPTIGPIRDEHPCKTCTDNQQRPTCRKDCEKDAAWHDELERVKSNRRKYEQQLGIGLKRK